ncbi:MAG: hypothetical protein ABWZ57_14410 [Mesorhizobium sp.]
MKAPNGARQVPALPGDAQAARKTGPVIRVAYATGRASCFMKRAFTGAGDENKAGFGGSEPEIEPIGGRNAEQELDVGAAHTAPGWNVGERGPRAAGQQDARRESVKASTATSRSVKLD